MRRILNYLLFFPLFVFSQQESYYSLYQYNMQVINPAYAGAEAQNTFSFLNRTQWQSLDDSPRTMALAYSSNRDNNVGLGLSIVSDKIFVEKQTFAYVDFSYVLDMEETKIYLGLKAGGNFYQSSSLNLDDLNSLVDPAQKELSRFNPNVGAGIYLKNLKYWFSFSVPRLFNVKRNDDFNLGAKDRVHAYLAGGMAYGINDAFILKPSIMFRKVASLPISTDFSAFLSFQDRIDLGMSYRSNAAMSLLFFINLFNGIDMGYAYETPSNKILAGEKIQTHEVFFRIRLDKNVESKEQSESTGGPMNQ